MPLFFWYAYRMPVWVFWGLISGFVLGIGVRSLAAVGFSFVLLLCLLALCVLLVSWSNVRAFPRAVVCAVFLAAFAFGVIRADSARILVDPVLAAHVGERVVIEGDVVREPDVRDGSVRIVVSVQRVASSSEPTHAMVLAILPAFTDVSYGSRVRVEGVLGIPEAFDAGHERSFDYPGYLASQGVAYRMAFAQAQVQQGFHGNQFMRFALDTKHCIMK